MIRIIGSSCINRAYRPPNCQQPVLARSSPGSSLFYQFSGRKINQKPSENERSQKKCEITAKDYLADVRKLQRGERSNIQPYVNRLHSIHKFNNHYLIRLKRAAAFYRVKPFSTEKPAPEDQKQQQQEKAQSKYNQFMNEFKKRYPNSMPFMIMPAFFVASILLTIYALSKNAKEHREFQEMVVREKLENLRKVTIISKENKPDQKDFEEFKKVFSGAKQYSRYAIRHMLWKRYKIILEDVEGKVVQIQNYYGDPNKFISAVEAAQTGVNVYDRAKVFYENQTSYSLSDAFIEALGFATPFLGVLLTFYIFRTMDPTSMLKKFGQGKNNFKIEALKDIKTRFKDVAGMEQSKREVTEFVDFLKNSQKYRDMGAKIPKGALLTGPPGTGKTMLARACAGEADVAFFYISGSQFVEIFAGLGASKVRDLFAKARAEAPSIIFIDEIDAIGMKRQTSRNEERDSTLNQLLVEMDGFSSNETVIVLAASNRKQTLDSALLRPGRFDRMVEINLPDVKAREEIYMVHLAPLKVNPDQEVRSIAKRLAELSPGFSGADAANLCNEAAIIATRKNKAFIEDADFEQAAERVTAGYIKKNLMNEKIKKRVAYHQAGHAVSGWFLKGGDPLLKLTIIPRSKGSLGYAQYLPKASYIITRDDLIDRVAIMLGGIMSEEIFFGDMSSGGSDDLQKVYDLTRRMITQFGMGKETYNMSLNEETQVQKESQYLVNLMDSEIEQLIKEARARSKRVIEEKRDIIQKLALELIEKETINQQDILRIMGERPDFGVPSSIPQEATV